MILALTAVVVDATKPAGTIEPRMPHRQDIELARGEPLTIHLSVLGSNHVARDITGHSIRMGVRHFREDEAAKITVAGTLVTPASGLCDIVLPAGATDTLNEHGYYWYDIQLTDPTGARWQVVPYSSLRIAPVVNRPTDPTTIA